MTQGWREQAKCRKKDPNFFFPHPSELKKTKAAKAFCQGCLCRRECLDYALTTNEEHGIYGGTTPEERTLMRGILSSSSVQPRKKSLLLEVEIRTDHRTLSTNTLQRSLVASIPPLVLNLSAHQAQSSHSLSVGASAPTESGFSVPAFRLRFN